MSAADDGGGAAARRARPRPRRSRRSRTTRSSPTATPARSSRPTGRSTGSACRASTRRASSAACSTAGPGRSASRRSGSTTRRRASYEPGTNVLVTTWKTPTGWVVVRDALTMGPADHEDTITPHTRPPADDDAEHMLVRTVECLEGRVEVELVCEPVFDYGREPADVDARRRGSSHGRRDAAPARRSACGSDLALGIEGNRVRARHVLEPGERAYCALSWAEGLAAPADVDEAAARIAATTRFWRGWLGRARIPDHRWRDPIQRSALAIKGLTYMPTGATVAALTTSLPETPGGERNWDYRYTWMRDTTFTLQALHCLNLDWEADEFMQFVADVEPNEDGALQIMYGIDGRRDLTESTLDHLSGYAGARPVRIGNGAFDQRQNDVFGAVLDSILLHTRRSKRLPRGCGRSSGRRRSARRRSGSSPTRASGRRAASRSTTSRRSSCAGSRSTARRSWPRSAATRSCRRRGGRPRKRSARTSSSTASATGACCASTTRPTRSTPRRCWRRSSGSCPATTSGCGQDACSAIADELTERRLRPALPHRRDRRRALRQGGDVPHLLVLARVGARDRRRDAAGAGPDGAAAAHRLAARPVRRGVRRGHGPAPRQLPAGVLAPGADRGSGADHRGRANRGDLVMEPTTSSSSAPAQAAGRSRATSLHRASASCCSSAATGSRASRRTGRTRACSWTTATSRRTRGTTRRASPSSRGSTTSSAARRSSTARRCTGCARRTSASSAITTASRPPGRSRTTSSSRTTRSPSSTTRCTARAARIRPSRRRARRIRYPAVSHEPRIQQLADDLAAAGYRPFHAPCGIMLERVQHAVQHVHPLRHAATASRASSTPSPTRRCSACGRRSSTRTSRC